MAGLLGPKATAKKINRTLQSRRRLPGADFRFPKLKHGDQVCLFVKRAEIFGPNPENLFQIRRVDGTLAAGIDEPIWSPPAQDEAAHLTRLLSDAGLEAGRGGTVVSQSRASQGSQAREARRSPYRDAKRLRKAQETVEAQKDTINTLRHQIRDLRKAVKEAETQESNIRGLSGMIECLRARLRDFQDQRDTIRVLNWQVDTLRLDLDGLRGSLKRSEDEKKALEAEMAELRATKSVLSRGLFGRKSEQQKKPGTGRKRGQQRGAPGHGHTQEAQA